MWKGEGRYTMQCRLRVQSIDGGLSGLPSSDEIRKAENSSGLFLAVMGLRNKVLVSMFAFRTIGSAILMAIAAAPPPVLAGAGPMDLPLAGRYVVVGIRSASDVAATASISQSDPNKNLIGTELRFGDQVTWYREGKGCEVRPGPDETAARVERNIADLQIAPASTDARLNRTLVVDCLGRASSDIWEVLVVDQRVLVARRSPLTTYLILEQPLAPGDIRLLKQKLRQAGFDPGSEDETMDDSTRAAVASFARTKGAPFLTPGIVTENLLNALEERSSH
jgi:hypothetical protein